MQENKSRYKLRSITSQLPLGFSSGLGLPITGTALQAWLKNEGIGIKEIGLTNLIGLPYTFKFLWAPLFDRYSPVFLGRRRGWMITLQIFLVAAVFALSFCSPSENLQLLTIMAVSVAFLSASQDIVLDAFRRDSVEDKSQGLAASLFTTGYRLAMIAGGPLAIAYAPDIGWSMVYKILSGLFSIGILATLFSSEPDAPKISVNILEVYKEPLKEFFSRTCVIEILLFLLLYKLPDAFAASLNTPFLLDIGFTNKEVGFVGKVANVSGAILGALFGGTLMIKLGLFRALLYFGILQSISILGFSFLAYIGADPSLLFGISFVEYFTGGMGTTALVSLLAVLCKKEYSATQYALLSSLVAVPRVIFSSSSGFIAESIGWVWFYIFCTSLSIPGLLLLLRWHSWEVEGEK